jgi:hypothetical protein
MNVLVDALSRRSHLNMLVTRELLPEFCKEFEKLNIGWVSNIEVITMKSRFNVGARYSKRPT